jgi:hypothetical protein
MPSGAFILLLPRNIATMRDQAFRAATNTVCLAEVSNGDDAEGS